VDEGACIRLMKGLNQRYAQYVNRTHERTGTLWEGRYRSGIVFSARYVLACHRYIELNPVRAGIVRHPSRYPWSSYGANAVGLDNPLIQPHGAYAALARSPAARQSVYRALVEEAVESSLVDNIRTEGKKRTSSGAPRVDVAKLSTGV